MQTVTSTEVQPIVEAILNYFGHDVARVRSFYIAAVHDAKLRGAIPLVDAILDGIDKWLVDNDWGPRLKNLYGNLTAEEVLASDEFEEWNGRL